MSTDPNDPKHPLNDPSHPLHQNFVDAAKIQAARQVKYEPFKLPPGSVMEVVPQRGKGNPADLPTVYSNYALQLTEAINYLVKNNTGLAKVPCSNLGVTPHHLRNILREVRNFMKSNPPMNYPVENLTFTAIPDGVVVRDKKRSEPFKITTPISEPGAASPFIASLEIITALGIVLHAVDSAGAPVVWPDFVLETDSDKVDAFMGQIKSAFPPFWVATACGYYIEVKRT